MAEMRECPARTVQVGTAIAAAGMMVVAVGIGVATFGAAIPVSVGLVAAALVVGGGAIAGGGLATHAIQERLNENRNEAEAASERLAQARAEALQVGEECAQTAAQVVEADEDREQARREEEREQVAASALEGTKRRALLIPLIAQQQPRRSVQQEGSFQSFTPYRR